MADMEITPGDADARMITRIEELNGTLPGDLEELSDLQGGVAHALVIVKEDGGLIRMCTHLLKSFEWPLMDIFGAAAQVPLEVVDNSARGLRRTECLKALVKTRHVELHPIVAALIKLMNAAIGHHIPRTRALEDTNTIPRYFPGPAEAYARRAQKMSLPQLFDVIDSVFDFIRAERWGPNDIKELRANLVKAAWDPLASSVGVWAGLNCFFEALERKARTQRFENRGLDGLAAGNLSEWRAVGRDTVWNPVDENEGNAAVAGSNEEEGLANGPLLEQTAVNPDTVWNPVDENEGNAAVAGSNEEEGLANGPLVEQTAVGRDTVWSPVDENEGNAAVAAPNEAVRLGENAEPEGAEPIGAKRARNSSRAAQTDSRKGGKKGRKSRSKKPLAPPLDGTHRKTFPPDPDVGEGGGAQSVLGYVETPPVSLRLEVAAPEGSGQPSFEKKREVESMQLEDGGRPVVEGAVPGLSAKFPSRSEASTFLHGPTGTGGAVSSPQLYQDLYDPVRNPVRENPADRLMAPPLLGGSPHTDRVFPWLEPMELGTDGDWIRRRESSRFVPALGGGSPLGTESDASTLAHVDVRSAARGSLGEFSVQPSNAMLVGQSGGSSPTRFGSEGTPYKHRYGASWATSPLPSFDSTEWEMLSELSERAAAEVGGMPGANAASPGQQGNSGGSLSPAQTVVPGLWGDQYAPLSPATPQSNTRFFEPARGAPVREGHGALAHIPGHSPPFQGIPLPYQGGPDQGALQPGGAYRGPVHQGGANYGALHQVGAYQVASLQRGPYHAAVHQGGANHGAVHPGGAYQAAVQQGGGYQAAVHQSGGYQAAAPQGGAYPQGGTYQAALHQGVLHHAHTVPPVGDQLYQPQPAAQTHLRETQSLPYAEPGHIGAPLSPAQSVFERSSPVTTPGTAMRSPQGSYGTGGASEAAMPRERMARFSMPNPVKLFSEFGRRFTKSAASPRGVVSDRGSPQGAPPHQGEQPPQVYHSYTDHPRSAHVRSERHVAPHAAHYDQFRRPVPSPTYADQFRPPVPLMAAHFGNANLADEAKPGSPLEPFPRARGIPPGRERGAGAAASAESGREALEREMQALSLWLEPVHTTPPEKAVQTDASSLAGAGGAAEAGPSAATDALGAADGSDGAGSVIGETDSADGATETEDFDGEDESDGESDGEDESDEDSDGEEESDEESDGANDDEESDDADGDVATNASGDGSDGPHAAAEQMVAGAVDQGTSSAVLVTPDVANRPNAHSYAYEERPTVVCRGAPETSRGCGAGHVVTGHNPSCIGATLAARKTGNSGSPAVTEAFLQSHLATPNPGDRFPFSGNRGAKLPPGRAYKPPMGVSTETGGLGGLSAGAAAGVPADRSVNGTTATGLGPWTVHVPGGPLEQQGPASAGSPNRFFALRASERARAREGAAYEDGHAENPSSVVTPFLQSSPNESSPGGEGSDASNRADAS